MLIFQLQENIKENLLWLRDHNELCDIILILGNSRVSAHSCVLASHSPVLAAVLQARLFAKNDWSILKPLIVSLDNEDKGSESSLNDTSGSCVLDLLISFIYGETIAVEETRIQELKDLSKLLGLSQHFTDGIQPSKIKDEDTPNTSSCQNVVIQTNQNFDQTTYIDDTTDKNLENFKDLNESSSQELKKDSIENIKTFKNRKSKIIKSHIDECLNSSLPETKISIKYKLDNDDESLLFSEANPTQVTNSNTSVDVSNSLNDAELWFQNELFISNNIKENKIENEEKIDVETCENSSFNRKCNENHYKRTNRIAFFCSICKSSFQRAHDLIKHVKRENHFSHVCQLCYLQLNEYEDQKSHFDQHDHPLPFFCLCCDLRFRTRAGLSMHSPKHSNTKPYTCKECGRGFKWRHSAQAHSITHRTHCHLLCDVCGFSSKYASTFQSHLKRHYGQSIPCPHPGCKFKSFRKTHLNDHLATHAKLRSHQCEVCGHSFSQAKNLKRHMRLHTPDTSFLKCTSYSNQNCPFKTTRPDKLRFHLIQKHNQKWHDKISMPDAPSSFIPVVKSLDISPEDSNKEVVKLEVPIFNSFDISEQEFKENIGEFKEENQDNYLGGSCNAEQLSENKSTTTATLSIDMNDLILDEQNSDMHSAESIESNTVCFGDSYETYIVPASSQDNSLIVSENIEYANRNDSLVLMENYEVLEDIHDESRQTSEEEHVSSFDDEKRDGSDKIEDIMGDLPVILQASAENDYPDSNMEYGLFRFL